MDVGSHTRVERKGAALVLLCVAQFVDVLDVNAVIVALQSIGQDLGFSQAGLQWVISSYVLFFAGFLFLSGRVADLWGRRRTFVAGLAVFTLLRLLGFPGDAGGLARPPGPRSGDHRTGGALDHNYHLHRGPGARRCRGRLDGGGRGGWG